MPSTRSIATPVRPGRGASCSGRPPIDYDADVLGYYEDNPHKDAPMPDEVAVVTNNRMIRMVVGATAIGFRMFTGRRLRVYPDLPTAFAETP